MGLFFIHMRRFITLFSICLLCTFYSTAQPAELYPPYWFTGMHQDTLQLIVKMKDASSSRFSLTHPHVRLISQHKSEQNDYALLHLLVDDNAVAGWVELVVENGRQKQKIRYELRNRFADIRQALTQQDQIYLIMPDRFANALPQNDVVRTYQENTVNRNQPDARHGGDLEGVIKNLDYIQQTGFTAVWLTPFQENNEPKQSYHGYAITNHYLTDARMGKNQDYVRLVHEAHQRKMKVVMDMVFNHIGDQHWIYKDKPFPGFIHQHDSFQRTNYRANTLLDPYVAPSDQKRFTEGWFDYHMPDLNTENPLLARYLIQNTMWWLETSGADAIRIDTYTYPEQSFMKKWYTEVRQQYPDISIFGEIWEHAVPMQSFFVPRSESKDSSMQQVLDFQFCFAVNKLLNESYGWTEGVSRLYYVLSQDFLYANPYEHVIFIDNHDLDRFFAQVNGDMKKFKAGLGLLMTMRGIPCTFYGTEVLMQGKGPHGVIREDMKGGWAGDSSDYFRHHGLSPLQKSAYAYFQKLSLWRKSAIGPASKLMQYVPEDGVYVYFRYGDGKKVMVVYNGSSKQASVKLSRFKDLLKGNESFLDILTGESLSDVQTISVETGEIRIFEVD
jgi:glycosidase